MNQQQSESLETADHTDVAPQADAPTVEEVSTEPDHAEPMTTSLMARLFAVPLVIVSLIVGCAVVVVLLFGSIATDQEQSIDDLLTKLETRSGEKTVGVLLPNEKELWQASRELALRLGKKEREQLSDEDLEDITTRLCTILDSDDVQRETESDWVLKKRHFVMKAAAMTESPEAIDALLPYLESGDPLTRGQALASLADMRHLPEIDRALPKLLMKLEDSDSAIQMQACAAVSQIAERGDPVALASLLKAYLTDDREVQWNATLAIARLGSLKSKPMLLDMLTRSYWENDVRMRRETQPGSFVEYPLPPLTISRYLVAAVEAAAHVMDDEITTQMGLLTEDESPEVREAVRRVREQNNA